MLKRYILFSYLKVFLIVLIALLGILYSYVIGEVLIVFKEKDLKVLLSYTINMLPNVFFYISAFVCGIALLISFRRLLQRKIDLLSQSFGISPLTFSHYLILFSLLLSFLNLAGSYSLYPKSWKNLHRIEREYKKAKEVEKGIVRNLWLIEEKNGQKKFYQFALVETSTGNIHGFYGLTVEGDSIKELITADIGTWKGAVVKLKGARVKNLITGEEVVDDINIEYIDISRIEPLAEKMEHLTMDNLILLGMLGAKIGVNQKLYYYEVLRRVLSSFLSFFLLTILCWVYLRWRRFKVATLSLIIFFFFHWFLLNLMRILIENTNTGFLLISLVYAPIPLIFLKGLYDLSKGFRV